MPEIPDRGPQHDVLFYRISDSDERLRLYNLYNLLVTAATQGLLANSARCGLGTHVPVGPSLRSEGLYYQALRVISCFDHALARALREPSSWPLPPSVALLAGRFPSAFVDQRDDERLAPILRLHEVAQVLAPQLEPFRFRRLRDADCWSDERARTISFGRQLRQQLWRGTSNKLETIARDCSSADVPAKLAAMIGAFAPLCTVFSARFDASAPHRSYTRLVAYLPAYHTLTATDDDPARWSLEMGLRPLALREPVQIQTAEITHLSYLQELRPAERQNQAIRLEVRRDFCDPDEIISEVSFGRLFSGSQDELYAFDTADHRDALYVTYRASLPIQDNEASAARPLKEAFNKAFGWFEIDARIHQLTLQLRRSNPGDDGVLRPRFCLEDSKLSFRVHRHTDSLLERMWLRATGFEVAETPDERGRVHCWRDFRTWQQLRDELLTPQRSGALLHWDGEILSRLVGMATREVLERSIANIEDAIDAEIAGIVSDYLQRYQRARAILSDRLNEGLF